MGMLYKSCTWFTGEGWRWGCYTSIARGSQVKEGDGDAAQVDPPLLQHSHYYLMGLRADYLAEDWVDEKAVVEDAAWIDRYRVNFELATKALASNLLS
jgi:hypothetical protein